jgi:hypothetical protein
MTRGGLEAARGGSGRVRLGKARGRLGKARRQGPGTEAVGGPRRGTRSAYDVAARARRRLAEVVSLYPCLNA